MKTILLIFTGSGVGGVLRYFTQKLFIDMGYVGFPAGTFIVNIVGCFLIGLFNAMADKNNTISPDARLALTTGFCGGFTTFSTFANENVNLLRNGNYILFSTYILSSFIIGIAAVFFGSNMLKFF